MLEWIFLGLSALGWLGAAYFLSHNQRSLTYWGVFIGACVLVLIGVVLVLFTFDPPLWLMLVIGLLPVLGVAYGYRLYDHYSERAKAKREGYQDAYQGEEPEQR
ncbi:hypothetical protein G4Y79_13790 [Phototrophicus methaneseepsis]|uniref:Uncharacterized protein n=1 Tax=Phototrophicus methaneseepsis TaxID=2710758 RepID=A0A7S8E5K7_9CHLR|nr:hypothetical protein [Phototrophicus methaneseepsis]QPC80781.1 hypothetical protein G4Y79_13790 [Phototrophicus methaneseepsis]